MKMRSNIKSTSLYTLYLAIFLISFSRMGMAQTLDDREMETALQPDQEEEKEFEGKVFDLDVVVVTASRLEETAADTVSLIEVITRAKIEESVAENASDLLEEHNGVQVTRSFRGAGVRLQGFDSKHVLILIDGERQVGRIDGVIDLNRIPTDLIEQIEIVKGPSSSLYGSDAMGGVINIVTRRPSDHSRYSLRASYGSRSTADISGESSFQVGSWGSQLLLSYNQRDAFDLDPTDLSTSGSAFTRWGANYKTSLEINPRFKIDSRAEYTYMDLSGVEASNAKLVFDRKNRRETTIISIRPQFRISKTSAVNLSMSYQLYRDQFVFDQRGGTTRDLDQETKEGLSQLSSSYHLTIGSHLVNFGGEAFHQDLSSERLDKGEAQRWRGAVYLQDEWFLPSDLELTLVSGLRVDFDSQFGEFVSPKLALRFDPTSSLITRVSYGMGYRAPAFKELFLFFENPSVGYVVEGNPDLRPETSHSINLGLEYSLTKEIKCSINGFHHEVSQLIASKLGELDDNGLRRFKYENIDRVRHQGFELTSIAILPLNLQLRVGYILNSSRDLTQARPLVGRALHQGTSELKYHHRPSATVASVSATWSGSRRFYNDLDGDGTEETLYAAPYTTIDVALKRGLGSYLQLFINLENILNEGDHQFLAIQPFTISAGLSLSN